VFLGGSRRVIWLLAIGWLAGPLVLLLMPIWLMGVALARLPALVRLGRPVGALLLGAAAATFLLARTVDMPALTWLQAHSPLPLVNSQNVVGNTLMGLAVALALAGVRP